EIRILKKQKDDLTKMKEERVAAKAQREADLLEWMVEEVQATHEVVRANIIKANAKYKITADKHRRKKLFQIGDERGNEEDMIKELSKEYMDHLERDKSKGTNMSNVSAKHKVKQEDGGKTIDTTDRISTLPVFIVHHILSYLWKDIKSLVRMSVLSKEWETFYRYVEYTVSRFCDQNIRAHTLNICTTIINLEQRELVERFLDLVLEKGLQVMDIQFYNQYGWIKWLTPLSLETDVKGSILTLYKAGGRFLPLVEPEAASLPFVGVGLSTSQPPPYTVEDGIGTHNPWKTCELPSSLMVGAVKFKSLKLLSLTKLLIEEAMLEYLNKSCPILEEIYLRCCYGFKTFCVKRHQNLLKVEIYCGERLLLETIDVEAPNLSYFHLESDKYKDKAPSMFMGSCKKLTTFCYCGFPLKRFNDFLSNFPLLENVALDLPSRVNNLTLSNNSFRNIRLHSDCDLDQIDLNVPNLLLSEYYDQTDFHNSATLSREDSSLTKGCMKCVTAKYFDILWFQKLRRFLDKNGIFKVLKPRSLTLEVDQFSDTSDVVKYTYKKLLQQEDEGQTNIKFVLLSSSEDKQHFSDLYSLLKALSLDQGNSKESIDQLKSKITFIKEEDGKFLIPDQPDEWKKKKFMTTMMQKRKKDGDMEAWIKSNALVKGWILGSLSEQTLTHVVNVLNENSSDFTAKEVWDELRTLYGAPLLQQSPAAADIVYKEEERKTREIQPTGQQNLLTQSEKLTDEEKKKQETEEENRKKAAALAKVHQSLYEATLRQCFEDVDDILKNNETLKVSTQITINGNTALHVAVGTTKNMEFIMKMFTLVKEKSELLEQNADGSTLLHVAAIVGNTEAAKMLVEKETGLLSVPDKDGRVPLFKAHSSMHTETYLYLLEHDHNPHDLEMGTLGDELMYNAITSQDYHSAIRLIDKYPNLHRGYVLMAIAQNFPRKLTIWETILHKSPKTNIREMGAKMHNDAIELLKSTCIYIKESVDAKLYAYYYNNAVLEATRENAYEVVETIVSHLPNAIWSTNEDGHNIIQYAVINRSEMVYNLLYQMSEHKNVYKTIVDPLGNNLLHLAAGLAPPVKLNPISGAALQIQRELQWFKEVEQFVCPLNTIQKNHLGETPQMLFTKQHKELVTEGEKWMKTTAESYTITAALITTIVFAAAITVPGGSNQDTGIPVFAMKSAFTIFAISDAISLFTSVTSLLMFLSILTARFAEQDFLYKLPTKLIIGLITLFISTTAMIVAFGATLYLVFGKTHSWILAPIAILTCLPVSSFVFLQYPLIRDLMSSTYFRNIFGKKSDKLFY
nr:ankyrin repeat-containing domain, PGG domain protein [Tanacetum cinerariifolium]